MRRIHLASQWRGPNSIASPLRACFLLILLTLVVPFFSYAENRCAFVLSSAHGNALVHPRALERPILDLYSRYGLVPRQEGLLPAMMREHEGRGQISDRGILKFLDRIEKVQREVNGQRSHIFPSKVTSAAEATKVEMHLWSYVQEVVQLVEVLDHLVATGEKSARKASFSQEEKQFILLHIYTSKRYLLSLRDLEILNSSLEKHLPELNDQLAATVLIYKMYFKRFTEMQARAEKVEMR